ncbi:MAG: hypothetical protein R3E88_10330 [Myxococcota bacterium]
MAESAPGSPSRAAASGASRARRRRVALAAIGVLYVLSVPWYREPGAAPTLWLGLPSWVTVAIACYVAVAVLNALAWSWTTVEDAPVGEGGASAAPGAERR